LIGRMGGGSDANKGRGNVGGFFGEDIRHADCERASVCPLLAHCGHSLMSHLMSLLGVKRTCRCALHMSASDPKQTLRSSLNGLRLKRYDCSLLSLGASNEAARFYQSCCWLGGGGSVCRPRSAGRPHRAPRGTCRAGRGPSRPNGTTRGLPRRICATTA